MSGMKDAAMIDVGKGLAQSTKCCPSTQTRWRKRMERETRSAEQIQQEINSKLEAAGLGPHYRVGLPVRLEPHAPDGSNWHFMDVLTGSIDEMETVNAVLSDARRRYTMSEPT
jgi:hypothetical protein